MRCNLSIWAQADRKDTHKTSPKDTQKVTGKKRKSPASKTSSSKKKKPSKVPEVVIVDDDTDVVDPVEDDRKDTKDADFSDSTSGDEEEINLANILDAAPSPSSTPLTRRATKLPKKKSTGSSSKSN